MSPNPMESLFAQFSHFLVEEGFSVNEWQVVTAEFGVSNIAEGVHRFYRSWNFGDEDRQATTIKFLRRVHDEDEDLALNLMKRGYSMQGGADDDQLQRFPALEVLEDQDSGAVTVGVPQVPVHSERFLDIDNIPGTFYPELVDGINQCYRLGIYDATLVLTRKLLENLLIDVLRNRYGTNRIDLYYHPNNGRFQGFNDLIQNFEDNLSDFEHLSGALDSDFIRELDSFRENANAEAHSIETSLSQDEIEEYRDQASHAARVLIRVNENI